MVALKPRIECMGVMCTEFDISAAQWRSTRHTSSAHMTCIELCRRCSLRYSYHARCWHDTNTGRAYRSTSRHSHAGRTAQHDKPKTPPVNPQSWAAANSLATKSNRYQKLALQLAPNVAIRPDHGCAWDIHDGTHNILVSDDAVDTRALQVCIIS